MKNFFEIGSVFQLNGKNYEVVEGIGDDMYGTCVKCSLYGGKPGTCQLSGYPNLVGACFSDSRLDGKDAHFVSTSKPADYNCDENEKEVQETISPLTPEEKAILKEENGNYADKFNDYESIYSVERIRQNSDQEKIQPKNGNSVNLTVVKAISENGVEIGGVLITDENGEKYIMPYGSKVLMDGTCNLVKFKQDTLSYQTPYVDITGRRIYTGDILKLTVFGDSTRDYVVKTATVQKNGLLYAFYGSDDKQINEAKIVDNKVINGVIISDRLPSEYVMQCFASVKDAFFKLIGNVSNFGDEEFKAIYSLFNVEDYVNYHHLKEGASSFNDAACSKTNLRVEAASPEA